jgi:hypothetical protein
MTTARISTEFQEPGVPAVLDLSLALRESFFSSRS